MKMEKNFIKILLVEDDVNLGFLLIEFLESNGFDVKLYRDGESGFKGFHKGQFDFCILDVMLPNIDGFTLAKKIRTENRKIPIIMLTARSLQEDKIKGFNIGIDDYITKPFDEEELVCRIKAILMRVGIDENIKEAILFKIGKYQFDYKNQMLSFDDSKKRLTTKESEILRFLCLSKSKIVKRNDIMISVWGNDDYFIGRSLDVFISKLRKHLDKDPNIKIESIPRVGVVLSDKVN